MKKSLIVPLTRDETGARVAELVPMALDLLRDMLLTERAFIERPFNKKRNNVTLVESGPTRFGRYQLELVKTVLGAAGIGKPDAGKRKDLATMTAQEIMRSIDQATIIAHDPKSIVAKSLIDDE